MSGARAAAVGSAQAVAAPHPPHSHHTATTQTHGSTPARRTPTHTRTLLRMKSPGAYAALAMAAGTYTVLSSRSCRHSWITSTMPRRLRRCVPRMYVCAGRVVVGRCPVCVCLGGGGVRVCGGCLRHCGPRESHSSKHGRCSRRARCIPPPPPPPTHTRTHAFSLSLSLSPSRARAAPPSAPDHLWPAQVVRLAHGLALPQAAGHRARHVCGGGGGGQRGQRRVRVGAARAAQRECGSGGGSAEWWRAATWRAAARTGGAGGPTATHCLRAAQPQPPAARQACARAHL
jgi:hypothetical protein